MGQRRGTGRKSRGPARGRLEETPVMTYIQFSCYLLYERTKQMDISNIKTKGVLILLRIPSVTRCRFSLLCRTALLCLSIWVLVAPGGSALAGDTETQPESGSEPAERLSADQLVELKDRKASFKIVQGKDSGQCVTMTLKAPAASRDAWQLNFEGICRLSLRRTPEGGLRVGRMEMLKDKKRLFFHPPFELIPPFFTPGKQIQRTGTADIENMETGKLTNSGSYCHEIQALSRTTLDTPAGPIEGYLLEYEFRVDLDYSDLQLNLETGWSKNRRLVYWRTQTTIEKLGLFSETKLRVLAITDGCEGKAGKGP